MRDRRQFEPGTVLRLESCATDALDPGTRVRIVEDRGSALDFEFLSEQNEPEQHIGGMPADRFFSGNNWVPE